MEDRIVIYHTAGYNHKADALIDYLSKHLDEDSFVYDSISMSVDRSAFINCLYDCLDNLIKRAEKAENESNKYQNLNANLLRISRERANADRGLTPKKEHYGFVLLSYSDRFERVYNKSEKKYISVLTYKTVIQTPYSNKWDYESVVNQIWNELPFGSCRYASHGYNLSEQIFNERNKNRQYVFRWNLKLNGLGLDKTSYWEIELYHTKPLNYREESEESE